LNPTAYIETTVIGYLAMRPSRDIRTASNQLTTQEWWSNRRKDFQLVVSRFVLDECLAGDPIAAQERLAFLDGVPLLAVTPEIEQLADAIMKSLQIPQKAALDAFHISISAVHGIEFLLTWNCKHIANPENRSKIDSVCRALGFEPPTICTPFELLGTDSNE